MSSNRSSSNTFILFTKFTIFSCFTESGGHKDAKTLSGQITEKIEKAVGLFITVHQFRHAAAAMWLKTHPGDYETVRRTLGHRNIQTTINFYCGLETMQANEMFGNMVRKLMKFEPEPS